MQKQQLHAPLLLLALQPERGQASSGARSPTAIYELGPELMTYAAFDFELAIKRYKDCTESGDWPGYQKEITTIDLAAKPSAATNISFA